MRPHTSWMPHALLLLLPIGVTMGCQPAHPYNPRPAARVSPRDVGLPDGDAVPTVTPIPEDYAWMDDTGRLPSNKDDRIEFVHEGTNPQEWKKLPAYWNDSGLAGLSGVGLPGLPGATLLAAMQGRRVVRLKVPLGLADPQAFIPPANPPTRAKWELGRRLFFDPTWLTARGDQSCATCHRPTEGFTDGQARVADSYNTPTLINCVYNTHQFWDGRATHLEEVVQRTLQDEREPKAPEPFHHVWHGVIGRLRSNETYDRLFNEVFTVPPTQDAVGKALATYLRTLLAGNSLHDRAVQRTNQKTALTASHYEAVLDEAALKALGRPTAVKAIVASELLRGYTLFTGKAGCAQCHPASNGHFSNGRFCNTGVGVEELDRQGGQLGRFACAPLGERTRYLRGAFKTPTLRGLLRTGPYFHTGQESDLADVVRFHVGKKPIGAPVNLYLDPKLADADGNPRTFGLGADDVAVLTLFLKALNGEEVDRAVAAPPN